MVEALRAGQELSGGRLRVTDQMVEFLRVAGLALPTDGLDLTDTQADGLTGLGFRDRLVDGSLGLAMHWISAGSFSMGSAAHDKGSDDDEGPDHEVTLTRTFALGRFPVTFDEYDRFAAATQRQRPDDQGWGRGRRPVINVSWDDAVAYCAWLSAQTGQLYRLPTEAEWEYAARAGTRTRWSFGDEERQLSRYAWYRKNAGLTTHPGGEKLANPWGLHEMHGNVWEWCSD